MTNRTSSDQLTGNFSWARPSRIAVLAAIAILAFVAFWIVIEAGTAKRASALTAQVVDFVNQGEKVDVRIQVSNLTGHAYVPFPVRLETWNGRSWELRRGGFLHFVSTGVVEKHGNRLITCVIKRFDRTERLRLVIEGQRLRTGLAAFLFRVKLRVLGEDSGVPLNRLPILHSDVFATTDEFRSP